MNCNGDATGVFGIANDGSLLIDIASTMQRLAPGKNASDGLGSVPAAVSDPAKFEYYFVYQVGESNGLLWLLPLRNTDPQQPTTQVYVANYN